MFDRPSEPSTEAPVLALRNATSNASGAWPGSWNSWPPAMVNDSVVCEGERVKTCDREESWLVRSPSVALPLAKVTAPVVDQAKPAAAGLVTAKLPLVSGPAKAAAAALTVMPCCFSAD